MRCRAPETRHLRRTHPPAALRGPAALLLAGAAAWLGACAGVPPLEADPGEAARPYRSANALPPWSSQPLSWEKLEAIEEWLERNRYGARDSLVARADLELAEGRLAFARREAGTAPEALEQRLGAAQAGFQRVLANPGADPALLRRAHQGLLEARSIHPRGTAVAADDPSVVRRVRWGATPAVPARLTHHRGAWTALTVHHSAKENASQLGSGSDAEIADALRRVQHVHMADRGFGDIGYHFLIDPRGRVYEGRSMQWQGAHASGANNVGNIGVCLLGNFEVEAPSARALAALGNLIDDLRSRHRIPKSRVYGHGELRATECPGDRLMAWVTRYRGGPAPTAHNAGARPSQRAAGAIR